MANSLGRLVVSLGLDAAEFVSGLTKSDLQAKQFAQTLDKNIAAGIIKAEIALRALGAAARVAFDTFQSLTTGAGQFKDLEEETGASAESLAALAVAAATAGVEMGSVGAAANKLTKGLVGVDDDSKAAGAALQALNINIKDFKALDPVAQYEAVGKALAGYADGAGKTAVAIALFGKSGAEQLKVFKALEEQGGRQAILTQKQIEQADAYADAQAKSREQIKLYAQAAASEAIPALLDLTEAARLFIREVIGIDAETNKLGKNNGIQDFAERGISALASLATGMDVVARTFQVSGKSIAAVTASAKSFLFDNPSDVVRNLKAIGQAYSEDIIGTLNRPYLSDQLAQVKALRKEGDAARRLEDRGFTPQTKPTLKFNGANAGGASTAAALLKKDLDGQLRAIRDFADDQKAAFDFANQIVKGSYDDGLSTLQQFFEAQGVVRNAALQAQLSALDKEIAALEAYRAKAAKPEDRADASNKIADAERKRSEVIAKSSRDNVLAALEEGRALQQLSDRYVDLLARVLDASGDKRAAAGLRIARELADAQKTANAIGANPAIIDKLAKQLIGAADLSETQDRYNRLLEQTRNAEDAIYLAAQANGTSELDTLKAVGAAREKALVDLGKLADEARRLADELKTPDAEAFADRLALAFKRAAAEADPLLGKIRDIGKEMGDAIASSFEDAIVEGKGLRSVLQGLEKDLIRIITREAVTKPLGNYLGNLIGGNGQSSGGSGGGGWIGSLIGAVASWYGGSSFSAYDTSGIGITSGTSLADYGIGAGRAYGGPTRANTRYQVAERGPEIYDDGSRQWLLTGSRAGRVIPNQQAGGRNVVVNNNFHLSGPVDGRTQMQVGALAARSVAVANARNN